MFLALVILRASASADEAVSGWNRVGAANYLDERGKAWLSFTGANRGEGATRSSCVSCHTVLSYALGRPALRRLAGEPMVASEMKLIEQIKMRVDHWSEIDSPPYRLFYDSNEEKKKQSWGTEAVLNAFILAWEDRAEGRDQPGVSTARAFANLWQTQVADGTQTGSWDWINFGFEPFESNNGRYFGATLAAIAVGTAYGHDIKESAPGIDLKIELLRRFLRDNLASQNPHNRIWLLWASRCLTGVLTEQEQKTIIAELLAKQQADGGWRLASLGDFVRRDGTAQDSNSDGYATGLALYVLQVAKVPRDDPKIATGLKWLMAHQSESGGWRTSSVNKERDPSTNAGKFMSDAATACAVLALTAR